MAGASAGAAATGGVGAADAARAPWNARGLTVRDWEALMWTLPAVQLGDPGLARELLLRACELHGYAPGQGVHYLDGTLFEPGFSLDGAAAYAVATDRYVRDTNDDQVVDEPALDGAVARLAGKLAALGPNTLAAQKRLLKHWEDQPLDDAIEDSVAEFAAAFRTGEPQHFMGEFLARRRRR